MDAEMKADGAGWRNWLNMLVTSLFGGLTLGVVGGLTAGFLFYFLPAGFGFLQGFQAGLIGGVSGGLLAGLIQVLGFRRGISVRRVWVLLSTGIGGATWAIAVGLSNAAVDIAGTDWALVAGTGAAWAIAGAVIGALGGAASGARQRRYLLPEVVPTAEKWLQINLVGWAAGGIAFLPAAWTVGISLIGGGNPGPRGYQAIGNNPVFCFPACLGLFVLLPLWIIVQSLRWPGD